MGKKRTNHENDAIHELKRRISKSTNERNDALLSELYVELGDEYRRIGEYQQAIDYYQRAIRLSHTKNAFDENAAFAHRAIAEIFVNPEMNENKRAIEHAKKYLEYATRAKQVHLIQLAYHVLGWIYLQVYLNSSTSKHDSLLEKGKHWCEKCITYLAEKGHEIDSDQRAVRIGNDSLCRRARVRQVLSQICDKLGLFQLARTHHNAVMAYAIRNSDYDLQYRCLLSKLDFAGEQRLKTAIELVHVAKNLSNRELIETQLILAQEKARVKDFEGAKWDLISMYSSKSYTKLDNNEQFSFQQLLIVVYKTMERLKEISQFGERRKARVYEKIADEFYNIDLREVSLDFYKLMSNCSSTATLNERITALVSVAVTAKELNRFEEAYQNFIKVDSLESQLRSLSDRKRAETAICIATTASFVKTLSNCRVMELFRKAESLAVTKTQKYDLYEVMLEYLRKTNADESLIELTECKMNEAKREMDRNTCDNDDNDSDSDNDARSSYSDEWDEMGESEIMERCLTESTRRSVDERIKREKDKVINSYGETRLHEAARGDDCDYLKTLINAGYNLNAQDGGGWTPLHEAIGAQKLENVRILLESGAKPDIRSCEGTLSADGKRTDSGGLTPLMEACDRGATSMISLLLKFNAKVQIKNPDQWMAIHFLRNAIRGGMVEDEDLQEAKRLESAMEMKLKQANVRTNDSINVIPPKRLAIERSEKQKCNKRNEEDQRGTSLINVDDDALLYADECNKEPVLNHVHSFDSVVVRNDGTTMESQRISVVDDDDSDGFLYDDIDELGKDIHTSRTKSSRSTADDISFPPIISSRTQQQNTSKTSRKRHSSTFTSLSSSHTDQPRSSASKQMCHRVIELSDDEMLSDASDRVDVSVDWTVDNGDRDGSLPSTRNVIVKSATRRNPTATNRASRVTVNQSNDNATTSRECVSSSVPLSTPLSAPSSSSSLVDNVSSRLLLIKVVFVAHPSGMRLKTKAIPFASTIRIAEVKERCKAEMSADGQFDALHLFDKDSSDGCECELDDETPLDLIIQQKTNYQFECRLFGWMPPSAAHLYSIKTKCKMNDIVKALSEAMTSGRLCLTNISLNTSGDDDDKQALICALKAFKCNSLSSVLINNNFISNHFIESIAQHGGSLQNLSMQCCQLNSMSVRLLLESNPARNFAQLTYLDLSYNEIGTDDGLNALISVCANLVHLSLVSCNLQTSTVSQLIQTIQGCINLKDLNLSQNLSVQSEHVTTILDSDLKLERLNIAASGVDEIYTVQRESGLMQLNMSMCELDDGNDAILECLLNCCHQLQSVDLRATNLTVTQLQHFCKQKANKLPITTLKLQGCSDIEAKFEEFVSMLRLEIRTDFAVRFELCEQLRMKLLDALSQSFAFCFV